MVSLKKRKLAAGSGPAPKRTKRQDERRKGEERPTGNDKTEAPRRNTKAAASRGRVVDATSLAWKPVGEEFGELQVITGVQVVKHGDKVEFLVKEIEDGQDATAEESEEQEESFEGFGDDVVESKDVDSGKAGGVEAGLQGEEPRCQDSAKESASKKKSERAAEQRGKTSKNKTSKKQPAVGDAGLEAGNSFEPLVAMAQDSGGDVDVAEWVALNLSTGMLSCVAGLGFSQPTRIQRMAIAEILAGQDVIGKAETGSGKTLAFGIPIVEKWLEVKESAQDEADDDGQRCIMAVVLSPTRELAKQLGDHLKALCRQADPAPRICVVTGGLSIQKQQRQLAQANVIIATPGRLWEVMDGDAPLQEALSRTHFLVIDEADRLLQAGQFEEARSIIGALDRCAPGAEAAEEEQQRDDELPPRQTLVFSATLDKDLQTRLKGKGRRAGGEEDRMAYLMKCLRFRREPRFLDANPESRLAANLKEGLIECGAMEKDLYLYTVLLLNPGRRTLVFTNSISAVRRITPLLLNLGLEALPLHSQMAQKARLRSIERFAAPVAKAGSKAPILVATDVAARGLDIHAVDLVIHYHVPRTADAYIHRSGRTARAQRTGVSIVLCSPDEVLSTRRLAAKVHVQRGQQEKALAIESLPVNRRVAARLKPRVALAKELADAALAKEKARGDEAWMRAAAQDLGVEGERGWAAEEGKGGVWVDEGGDGGVEGEAFARVEDEGEYGGE
ncbi:hypothetical protein CDD81_983 [Ophiocordyceps australis]|uniref:ATP-dependent RNA helicase n=1 Tax=Ophiocordyceps australis TaxID=1399860 RepID=A0A2C5XFQ4_9HYPO|nr:hypothetical protein CDD81_983 [Ophiocordyceps australis]